MNKTSHTIVAALMAAAFTNQTVRADLTGSLETNVVSNYTYHGKVLDSNPVFCPKLNLQVPLFAGGSLQASAKQVVGTTGSTWYRSDYNAGLALNVGRVTFTPGVEVTAYPDRALDNSTGITARLSVNDQGWSPLALYPYVYTSRAVDPKGGYYYEVGVNPGTSFGKLDVKVPITLGASSKNYLAKAGKELTYGFTGVGLNLVYHVTDRFALSAGSTLYTTDSRLSNSSNNFVQNQAGVSVSF